MQGRLQKLRVAGAAGMLAALAVAFLAVPGQADLLPQFADSVLVGASDFVPSQDACYELYPDSLAVSPFKKVFKLYTSHSVLNGYDPPVYPGWDHDDVVTFMKGIFDSTVAGWTGSFPSSWAYFCRGDAATAIDSVYYHEAGGPSYDKIELVLYSTSDFCDQYLDSTTCAADSQYCCGCKRFPEQYGFGTADQNSLVWSVSRRWGVADNWHHLVSPDSAASGAGLPHEMQHLAWYANGLSSNDVPNSEFWSGLAEYQGGLRWEDPGFRSTRYVNESLNSHKSGTVDPAPYSLYRLFAAYLFGHFSESESSVEESQSHT